MSTAADVLDVHANLLPMGVLIDKVRCRAALRLATLPRSHPLFEFVRRAARRRVRRHATPIHGLLHDFDIDPRELEKVEPAKVNPKWRPPFRVAIAPSREAAIKMDDDDAAAIQIYTDGSGMDGTVGAAAVLYRNRQQKRSLRFQLGSDRDHTVFEAEGIGLVLGMELLRQERTVSRATLAADNVASILRSASTNAAPAQYIWDMFHDGWGKG